MNDVDYRAKELKRIGRGFQNMNRRGRGAVHLPQDYMTKGEMKKMNGEVQTYDFSKRILRKEFVQMPKDIQQEYYEYLYKRFQLSNVDFAEVLGVSRTNIGLFIKTHGIKTHTFHGQMPKDNVEDFRRYLKGEEPVVEPVVEPEVEEDIPECGPIEERPKVVQVNSLNTTLTGNWRDILLYLSRYPISLENDIRVVITVEPV